MASSLKLEFPLNDALPNTDHARERFLTRIFKYRKAHSNTQSKDDEDFALFYAYGKFFHTEACCSSTNAIAVLVTGQISKEISEIVQVLENLFGVLDEDLLKLQ